MAPKLQPNDRAGARGESEREDRGEEFLAQFDLSQADSRNLPRVYGPAGLLSLSFPGEVRLVLP